MGGVGAAAGPLIGGLITSALSWRWAFVFQALIIAVIVWLSRGLSDPLPADPTKPFDAGGAVLSAAGLVLVVTGILAADNNVWLMLGLLAAGALVLALFFRSVRAKERAGKEPLLSTELFRSRTSNLGLITQNAQWLVLMGVSFVVAAYPPGRARLRRDPDRRHLHRRHASGSSRPRSPPSGWPSDTPSARSSWPASSSRNRGIGALLAMVAGSPSVWAFAPGLLLIGLGVGLMLTPSVNVVQSSFGEQRQGEISGLSRSVSNLGSSLGTAIAGTIIVAGITVTPERSYGLAMVVLAIVALAGLIAAARLPRTNTASDTT